MPDQTCLKCCFWEQNDQDVGFCHRYPPSTFADGEFSIMTEYPLTAKDEWCGEWQKRLNEGCFFSEWINRRGCAQSTAYRMRSELRAALGINFEKRRHGKTVEVWLSSASEALFDAYADALDSGLSIGDALAAVGRSDLASSAQKVSPAQEKPIQLTVGEAIESAFHGQGFWLTLLSSKYIPMILGEGRQLFTTADLFKWIKEGSQVELTAGDLKPESNSVVYKRMVSDALASLKYQKVLSARPRGKIYFINKSIYEAYYGE